MIGRPQLDRELPAKRWHAEVTAQPLAALAPSAGTILISKLILTSISGAIGTRQYSARPSGRFRPFAMDAVYVDNLGDEGQDRVKAAYRENYDRLLALKRKYDPNNLFRLNQNIRP